MQNALNPCPIFPEILIFLSMVLVWYVIRRLPNSLYPTGRIHRRTCGCKWSLLKVRKGKYRAEHDVAQVKSGGQDIVLFFLRYF
jgi:hypothetical protein